MMQREEMERKRARLWWGVAVRKSYPLGTGKKSWLWLTRKQKFYFMKF